MKKRVHAYVEIYFASTVVKNMNAFGFGVADRATKY